MTEPVTIGRNEPCPCGSGKKYKRCCGVNAAPKLTQPSQPAGMPSMDPSAMEGFDPQMMMQFTQALQKLPKGQLQRLQSLMQKAMSGKDVTAEAQEFERTLPPDFQQMIQAFQMPAMQAMAEANQPMTETSTSEMTEEQARALVAKAAAEGAISQEQAQSLLEQPKAPALEAPVLPEPGIPSNFENEPQGEEASKFGKFWRNFAGKK